MMDFSEPSPSGPLSGTFAALEPNVTISGFEATIWIQVLRATFFDAPLVPSLPDEWRWWYAVVGVLAILAVYVIGLATEGVAGLLEGWLFDTGGPLRDWFLRTVDAPAKGWGDAQRWMWHSPQAFTEFARRRTRILLARNTSFNVLLLTVALALHVFSSKPPRWPLFLSVEFLGGLLLFALFFYVWLSAVKAWNRAVRDAGQIGTP